MGHVPADEQTRATLRKLKESGAFSQRDEDGKLKELDPAVTAELIDGEKQALLPVAVSTPPQPGMPPGAAVAGNPLNAARAGGAAAGHDGGAADGGRRRSRSGSAPQHRQTEDLMRQITQDLDNFNKSLVINFENAKHNMQKDLLELFKTTSKERLPDSFLMSLPKWGKNATKLHHIFSKSINKKRTDTAADRREVPFDLIVQPEVLEDIDGDIHDLIDTELKQCCGEEGVIITDMQKILRQVAELMQCLRLVEKQKQELKIEVVQLREQLQDKDAQVRDLGSRIATLDRDMREKDMEQDRLRDKCQREIEQAKKNRVMFFREICIYKTDIFRLQSGQADAHGRGGGPEREQKQSPRSRDGKDAATRRESGQPAVPDAPNFDVDFGGDNSGETQAAVDDAVRAARQEMDEKYAAKRAREREEYSAKEEKMKIKIQEALEEAEHQRKEKKKLEMELVEKSRELRKLKAQQSNDQDGDT